MNEFDFIKRIKNKTRMHGDFSQVVQGIGDDAAVIKPTSGRQLVVSADLLIEGIDFLRSATSARLLGRKSLAVSLSDVAAMGAKPRWALLSLGVTEDVWGTEFIDQLYEGVFELADKYGVTLVGGDTSRTPDKIVVDSIVLGECKEGAVISRTGAKPGDQIFVTGTLGASGAGLRLSNRGARITPVQETESEQRAIDAVLMRHLSPEPRVGWGMVLGQEKLASSMIDLSDGLSSDLHHICEDSNTGALIRALDLPIDPAVVELCGRRALDPLQLALHGGEDFELLFTTSPANASRLPKRVDGVTVTCIGTIEASDQGVRLEEGLRVWPLEAGGYEHFAARAKTV